MLSVLIIGFLNLGLGYALGLWMESRTARSAWHLSRFPRATQVVARQQPAAERGSPPASTTAASDLPPRPTEAVADTSKPAEATPIVGAAPTRFRDDSSEESPYVAMNRFEFEPFIEDWLTRDCERVRMVSGAIIDVDQVEQLTEQHGAMLIENVISELGKLLVNLVRKDRGFDRICRVSGESYLAFFGDTGLRNATICVERIRQSIQSTRFLAGERTVSMTVSCSISEWRSNEAYLIWLERLQLLAKESKRAGGNRTCVDNENTPQLIPQKPNTAKLREITLT